MISSFSGAWVVALFAAFMALSASIRGKGPIWWGVGALVVCFLLGFGIPFAVAEEIRSQVTVGGLLVSAAFSIGVTYAQRKSA